VIVLDTNVLSEPLKSEPDRAVLDWIAAQAESVTTAVSVGELLTGVRRLPSGRRRSGLLRAIEQILSAFSGSVLPYDEAAARKYAELQESRRIAGAPLSVEDGMIAAICATHAGALATRNTKDFRGLGLNLVDPWTAES
jgi:predicted nucleic acid-binding protein